MTTIVSTINLKGGVGKTSLTIAIAEILAAEHEKRVLLIDLDPQTNATIALIGESCWLQKDKAGETLHQLFYDEIHNASKFEFSKALVQNVSNIEGGIAGLDLLPSSLRMVELHESIKTISGNNLSVLKNASLEHIRNYDYVLIDCPPNLATITLNGIYMSDFFLIPTKPDNLSTYGIPQILEKVKSLNKKNKADGVSVHPLGIIVNMKREIELHRSTLRQLKAFHTRGEYPKVFTTEIKENSKLAEASAFESSFKSVRQKYGYGDYFDRISKLAQEFMEEIEHLNSK